MIILILNKYTPGEREEQRYRDPAKIRRLNEAMNEFRCPRCSGTLVPDHAHGGLYCEHGCRARWLNIDHEWQ